MPIIDVAVALAVLGFAMIGFGFVRSARKKQKAEDPRSQLAANREKGAKNLARFNAQDSMRCTVCGKQTSAEVDVFASGSWWHQDCYQKTVQ